MRRSYVAIREFRSSLRRDLNGNRAADSDLVSSSTNVKLEQMRFHEFLNRGSNQGFQGKILITWRIKTGYAIALITEKRRERVKY